jgi:hypothetical protein
MLSNCSDDSSSSMFIYTKTTRRNTMTINSQTQNLFAIDAVQDLSEESAAAIQGGAHLEHAGAHLELYDDSNFRKRLVSTNSGIGNVGKKANDRTTSIVINKGVWRFFTDTQGRGVFADLGPGRYANIGLGIIPNDSISSFQRIR